MRQKLYWIKQYSCNVKELLFKFISRHKSYVKHYPSFNVRNNMMCFRTSIIKYALSKNCKNIMMKSKNISYSATRGISNAWMWQEPRQKKGEYQPQKYDYLLVLDFEATCGNKGYEPTPQEIIEFPCAMISTKKNFEIVSIFHEYIRPIHNPTLTTFCTELTGITQVSLSKQIYVFYCWQHGWKIIISNQFRLIIITLHMLHVGIGILIICFQHSAISVRYMFQVIYNTGLMWKKRSQDQRKAIIQELYPKCWMSSTWLLKDVNTVA